MYETIQIQIDRISEAQNVLITIREAYQKLVTVHSLLERYLSDPVFQATVNSLFTQEEIADMATVISKADAFRADLEAYHRDVIGLS